MRSVSLALAPLVGLVLLAGCGGGSALSPTDPSAGIAPPVPGPDAAAEAGPSSASLGATIIDETGRAESALALYHLSVDPATLTAEFEPVASRGLQQTDDVYELSIADYISFNALQVVSVEGNAQTLDITYRFQHPFNAPGDLDAPATAANRSDLGISARVLFLLEVVSATGNTYFDGADPIVLDSSLVANADGYYNPRGLLGPLGLRTNTHPYKLLGDETWFGDGFREQVSNNGVMTGNYDPSVGWQRDTMGPERNGWTGYGVLHQGQSARQMVKLSQARIQGGARFDMYTAILAKYNDPRGGANGIEKRANRLPANPADVTKFVYRMPHGAIDVQKVTFLTEDGTLRPNTAGDTLVRFHVEDWDARAEESTFADLADEPVASKVAQGEAGLPTLEACLPGVLGNASEFVTFDPASTVFDNDAAFPSGDAGADSGMPSDALFYRCTIDNVVLSGQARGTYTGVVRAIDVEAGQDLGYFFPLDRSLVPLTENLPQPITYQVFRVTMGNAQPTLEVSLFDNTFLSGNRALLSVDSFDDPDGDPITVEINWDFDSTYEDTRTLIDGDPAPNWTSPLPYNNPSLSPTSGAVAVRYRDPFGDLIILDPLPYTLGGNRKPAITGTPVVESLGGGVYRILAGDTTADDLEDDPVFYTVTNDVTHEEVSGTVFPLAASFTPLPAGTTVEFSVYANDPLHPGLNGARYPDIPVTVPPAGWAQRYGGTYQEMINAVAYHPDGFFVAVGFFESDSISFGGPVRSNSVQGTDDAFALAVNLDGSYRWDRTWGGAILDHAKDVAVDAGGSVFIAGTTESATIDYGGGARTNNGSGDVYVLKLDSAGGYDWDYQVGGSSYDNATSITTGDGNVYIGGSFDSTSIDLGGGSVLRAGDTSDMFLLAVNDGGTYQWSDHYGDTGDPLFTAVQGAPGSVYAVGSFDGVVDFGGPVYGEVGVSTGVLLKLAAATGDWQEDHAVYKGFFTGVGINPAATRVTTTGSFIVSGVDFGGGSRTLVGSADMFLAQYDASCNWRWDQTFGEGNAIARGVTVDEAGDIYASCVHQGGPIDFGGGSRAPQLRNAFIAKWTTEGGYLWDTQWGSATQVVMSGPAVSSEMVCDGGFFSGLLDGNPGAGNLPLLNAGNGDGFLVAVSRETGQF